MISKSGFTIVELLIVIVIIGVLASIVTVAFSNLQARSRDAIRKSDLASVAKAISLYKVDRGDYIESSSGCGMGGSGEGWLSHPYTTYSPAPNGSIINCLRNGNYLSKDFIDPSGCTDAQPSPKCDLPSNAYMKVNCTLGASRYSYLLARLESGTAMSKPSDLNSSNCTYHAFWDAPYSMNYALRIN